MRFHLRSRRLLMRRGLTARDSQASVFRVLFSVQKKVVGGVSREVKVKMLRMSVAERKKKV